MGSHPLGFKGLGKGPSADIPPRCTWSSHLSQRRIFLFVSLRSLLATRGPSVRRLKTGRRKWDSPVQHTPLTQTHLMWTQPVSSGRLKAEVRRKKVQPVQQVQRKNCNFISFYELLLKLMFFFQQVLPKHLLPHLSNLLRLQASLQPGRRTQRRLPVSWLKRGEKPDSSGRERSRSVCKERRRTGKKQVNPPLQDLPRNAHTTRVWTLHGTLQHVICSGAAVKSWSAGGQRSGRDSRPKLSVSSRRR